LRGTRLIPLVQSTVDTKGYLYATSGSSGQNGIKTGASSFRQSSKGASYDALREGFAECDNPAIQSVASASNENWIKEAADRQKDRDNISFAIKKGWTGADVIRGRAVISSVFLSISGNGDTFIFR